MGDPAAYAAGSQNTRSANCLDTPNLGAYRVAVFGPAGTAGHIVIMPSKAAEHDLAFEIVFHEASHTVDAQISNQQQLIDTNQARVDALKASLLQRIGAADALIASLEQQGNFITALFNYNNGSQSK